MNKLVTFGVAAVLALGAATAQASTISTGYAGGNSQDGIMFDVVVGANDLSITSLDINLEAGVADLELYVRAGTHVGNTGSLAGWTLVDSTTGLNTAGEGTGTTWDIADFVLGANATHAFYVNAFDAPNLVYSNGTGVGNVVVSNADLSILEGSGIADPINGSTNTPRYFNGAIDYDVVAPVPLPASLPLLFSAFLGLGVLRRRRKAA